MQLAEIRCGLAALALCLLAGAGNAAESARAFLPGRAAAPAPEGAEGLCSRHGWACARGDADLSRAQIALADRVNRAVNARVTQVSDQAQYGRAEVWALPTAAGGDCEDLALAKKRELVKAGLPPQRLLIATALDRNRSPHAVLVLRTGDGDYILDSLDDRIRRWSATGYVFLRMQDPAAPGRWVSVHAEG
jgi:predicted transglutaminase-like cysteine proteinase